MAEIADKAVEIAAATTAADLPDKAVTVAEVDTAAAIADRAAEIAADLPDKAAVDKAAVTATEDLHILRARDNLHRKEAVINDITKKSQVP